MVKKCEYIQSYKISPVIRRGVPPTPSLMDEPCGLGLELLFLVFDVRLPHISRK